MSRAVIDADGHVAEPLDLFEKYADVPLHGRMPRVVKDDLGYDRWVIEGKLYPIPEGREIGPKLRYGVFRKGMLDASERLKDMDTEAIQIAVIFPSVALRFGWGIEKSELAVAASRAYNNFLLEYCSAAPQRMKGVAALPLQDPSGAAEELRHLRQMVRADAPALLRRGEHDDDARRARKFLREVARREQDRRDARFHVGGAAPVEPVAVGFPCERVARPGPRAERYRVDMPGEAQGRPRIRAARARNDARAALGELVVGDAKAPLLEQRAEMPRAVALPARRIHRVESQQRPGQRYGVLHVRKCPSLERRQWSGCSTRDRMAVHVEHHRHHGVVARHPDQVHHRIDLFPLLYTNWCGV